MCVPIGFLDVFVSEAAVHGAVREGETPVTVECGVPVDVLALKYINKMVYVWRGERKGKVGMVQSISGEWARLSFESGIAGGSVRTIEKRRSAKVSPVCHRGRRLFC